MPAGNRAVQAGDEFEKMLVSVFRKAGLRVRRSLPARDMGVDLVLDGRERIYVVELKTSSEGRRDRLIPLLSQAILQAKAFARQFPETAVPVAVVAAEHIPVSVADQIHQFAERYAPGVGVGVIDAKGFRSFAGPGLEGLDERSSYSLPRHFAPSKRLPYLFSDLNQWMLKILLGQQLPEALISVPRALVRNASQLSRVAGVSVMSASRLVSRLADEGFLNTREDHLQLVRIDELLDRWVSAGTQMASNIPARWVLKQDEDQFLANVARYAAESHAKYPAGAQGRARRAEKRPLRCCIGLYAAANALGLGFVRGVPPHVYLEQLDLEVLQRLGLSVEDPGHHVDAYVRITPQKESVFRPAVIQGDLPVSDVLQVWFDVSAHPSRGRSQADEIRRRALGPLFGKQQ
jgi:Holliday junction resolvase